MRFQTSRWLPDVRPSQGLDVALGENTWDDYGYQTLYHPRLWLKSGRAVDLGDVKILQRGMSGGEPPVPDSFQNLGTEFCSLGQAPSYYETLKTADEQEPGLADSYLRAMRDAAADPAIHALFKDEPGFTTSLLRESAAETALDQGAAIISGDRYLDAERPLEFQFDLPGLTDPLTFSFAGGAELPSRLQAIIGYNGVGKTRLLASLGYVLARRKKERNENFAREWGYFVGGPPDIVGVLSVSFSAFDTFPIPDGSTERIYRYCGLRDIKTTDQERAEMLLRKLGRGDLADKLAQTELSVSNRAQTSQKTRFAEMHRTLKSIDQIRHEFHEARAAAVSKLREGELAEIFDPLLREPSFAMAGDLPALEAPRDEWEDALRGFSTGHTIVLNILVYLCAYLERRSLVLLDEPEMHLHPPLVAALR